MGFDEGAGSLHKAASMVGHRMEDHQTHLKHEAQREAEHRHHDDVKNMNEARELLLEYGSNRQTDVLDRLGGRSTPGY